ncbi:MAG TPA: CHASE domain-containing protein [Thermoanaerobaculia bacterium]|nr:CHASE domain-containing protein [Thermoanaerobaculia bacterium]
MTNGPGRSGRRSGPETGRFTTRRIRSAFSSWRASIRGTDVLVASVLAALSLGLGAYLFARAQAAVHLGFTQRAQRLQAAVTERLLLPQEDLNALSKFLEASGQPTRRQFRLLTDPMLLRHRFVYAFEWLPLVRELERSAYEAEARAAGLTDYRFWEAGPDAKPTEASHRPTYVPIHYMEPPSALALGFDIAANPLRWRTAERARDSGLVAASHPFELIEDAGQPDAWPVVAMYAPVYKEGDPASEAARRASLSGFALAILRVSPLVDTAAAAVDAASLGFTLRDPEAREARWLAQRPKEAAAAPRRTGFEIEFPVDFADRRLALRVFALPGAFLAPKRTAIGVASAGVIAALFGMVLVTSLRTILRLRRQVEKVGPYRLVARLGRGAMGVVWEARHALLRRPTAVKLLAPGTEGERSLARFEREVQLTAGLTHPSTIAIYDYGRTAEGVFYYAMELLQGINLLQLVGFEGPLPPARVVHLLRQACGALAEAHAAGLIHRDIKPANLMICVQGGIPDFLKVLDFGLVKDIGSIEHAPDRGAAEGHGDAALSQDGSLLGTPLYMAPEGMSDPSKVDARADLFALGAVGYFLLTGSSPFPGRTAIEVFAMERQGPPPPLSRVGRNPVPASLEQIIRRCLAFRAEDRPGSAQALDTMLEACAEIPPWRVEEARLWWQERGPAALAAARAQREERGQDLVLSSDYRAGS